jgi:hypothetical protein
MRGRGSFHSGILWKDGTICVRHCLASWCTIYLPFDKYGRVEEGQKPRQHELAKTVKSGVENELAGSSNQHIFVLIQ